jgi:hypothetical protein
MGAVWAAICVGGGNTEGDKRAQGGARAYGNTRSLELLGQDTEVIAARDIEQVRITLKGDRDNVLRRIAGSKGGAQQH